MRDSLLSFSKEPVPFDIEGRRFYVKKFGAMVFLNLNSKLSEAKDDQAAQLVYVLKAGLCEADGSPSIKDGEEGLLEALPINVAIALQTKILEVNKFDKLESEVSSAEKK